MPWSTEPRLIPSRWLRSRVFAPEDPRYFTFEIPVPGSAANRLLMRPLQTRQTTRQPTLCNVKQKGCAPEDTAFSWPAGLWMNWSTTKLVARCCSSSMWILHRRATTISAFAMQKSLQRWRLQCEDHSELNTIRACVRWRFVGRHAMETCGHQESSHRRACDSGDGYCTPCDAPPVREVRFTCPPECRSGLGPGIFVRSALETRTCRHSGFDFPTRLHGWILVLSQVDEARQ